jgi:hypothetical protein
MEHRGKPYSIVQGIEVGTWKWTVVIDERNTKSGTTRHREAAVITAERAIDKALAPIKRRLQRPGTNGPKIA